MYDPCSLQKHVNYLIIYLTCIIPHLVTPTSLGSLQIDWGTTPQNTTQMSKAEDYVSLTLNYMSKCEVL